MTKRRLAVTAGAAALAVAGVGHALTINPIFGATCGYCDEIGMPYGSLADNAAAQGAIQAAARQVAAQFGDTNITVNILFFTDPYTPALGESLPAPVAYPYQTYVAALAADAAAHPWNHALATAVANLPYGNGATGDSYVAVSPPSARALGLGVTSSDVGPQDSEPEFDAAGDLLGGGVGGGGTVDGIVWLGMNTGAPLSYVRAVPAPPPGPVNYMTPYDVQTTMEHEIDEVLGIGGGGSLLGDAYYDPNYAEDLDAVPGPLYGQMDLYRYSGLQIPSFQLFDEHFDREPSLADGGVYFSIDGGASRIDLFNNGLLGDSGDWAFIPAADPEYCSLVNNVQDAFGCPGVEPDVQPGSPEFTAFEAIGFNPVPEPDAWALFMVGAALAGSALRIGGRALPLSYFPGATRILIWLLSVCRRRNASGVASRPTTPVIAPA
jgi:hypothetical protein